MIYKLLIGFLGLVLLATVAMWLLNDEINLENIRTDSSATFKQEDTGLEDTENKISTKTDNFSSKDISEIDYAGWIPSWGDATGLDSISNGGSILNTISPVWYELGEDGDLIDSKGPNAEKIVIEARSRGKKIIPTISMFDHELFSQVASDRKNIEKHVEQILTELESEDLDGIDLNYESTKLVDADSYFYMLELLSEGLGKQENYFGEKKELVVTVLAQWETSGYKSLRETRQVQDWFKISEYADEIRIMTYDYTVSKALNPGPIAPTGWMQEVIDFALQQGVPREKIMLGVHLYSYEWFVEKSEYDDSLAEGRDLLRFVEVSDTNIPINNSPARSYTYPINTKLLVEEAKSASKNFEFEGERILQYSRVNPQTSILEERMLVFIDENGVKSRAELAAQNGLKGVVFWRIGDEGEIMQNLVN